MLALVKIRGRFFRGRSFEEILTEELSPTNFHW